jgi:hypothetical protein
MSGRWLPGALVRGVLHGRRMLRLFLAVAFVLGAGTVASADSKVDWSQFIEKPGDKPPPVTHAAAAEPVASKTPAPKAAKKKPAAKPKKATARKKK